VTGTLPGLSVVIPLLNEEENVGPLMDGVRSALGDDRSWELILVDDGSTDSTADLVREASRQDPRIRLVRLARRYGQSTAMQAGFDHARAETVVTMDGDMQNDPRDIPTVVAELEKGWDLVAGYRERRQDKLIRRKIPSWIANRIIARITGVKIRDNGCSLKAYRRDLLERVRLYSDMHRFIPALAAGTAGARIAEVPVRHHARTRGESKYGLSRVGKVIVDLLTIKMIRSFRLHPIRMFGAMSMIVGAVGLTFVFFAMRAFTAFDQEMARSMIFSGASILWLALSVFLLLLGLVGQVAVNTRLRFRPDPGPMIHEVHT